MAFDSRVPTEIAPHVWVGDEDTARDFGFFVHHRILRVINCTPDVPFYFSKWCKYIRIPVGDSKAKSQNAIMAASIPMAVDFISSPVPSKHNAVLIHCHVGVSRSCTVAAAYLRACCAVSIPRALSMVVERRPVAFFKGKHVNFKDALYANFEI